MENTQSQIRQNVLDHEKNYEEAKEIFGGTIGDLQKEIEPKVKQIDYQLIK